MKRLLCLLPILTGCGITLSPGMAQGAISTHALKRDPIAVIQSTDASYAKRNPDLVALKYKKMKESAFSFFRGSAPLFYQDIKGQLDGVPIPIQGDFHLENLGTYQTGGGAIAYDLNDFDESCTAPVSWELARCATSIRLALRDAKIQDASKHVDAFLASYRQTLQTLDSSELSRPFVPSNGPAADAIKAAKQHSYLDGMISNGKFLLGKKLRPVSEPEKGEIERAVQRYAGGKSFYRIKDVASRIAGTASIGRYRFAVLVEGLTDSPSDDRVLELKEETSPAASHTAGNQADRVCRAYGYFLPFPDPLLGTTRLLGMDFLVRELQPAKGGVELADLKQEDWPGFLATVAEVVARAHARSGKAAEILRGIDPAEISRFAQEYENQVEQDYQAFKKAL
ncbi:MAG: DUF2252 family protein [Bacteroidota bacterium]